VHFQHSVAELRRHFRAIGIFRQREAASESSKGSLDAMELKQAVVFLMSQEKFRSYKFQSEIGK
jgi:hypothetical protein